MKSSVFLRMLPLVLAMIVLASSKKAEAVDVHVGIGVGGGHHYYRDGAVVQYRTVDPEYNTWYPDDSTTYVYTPSTTYYDSNVYVEPAPAYVYSTESTGYVGWYGSGRTGRGGNYGGNNRGERRNEGRSGGGSGFRR